LDIFAKGEQDMAHFKIKVADLLVDVVAKGELTARICEPYLVDSAFTDISIYATPAQIKKKIASMPIPLTDEQAECICLHENLALKLVYHDAFVLHAALVSYKGKGYAIVAPRGVGKTVHAQMWQARFGDDVTVINGDKPILRRRSDGTYLAYGTPWCGKEGMGVNTAVPLCGICLLSRGSRDIVRPVTPEGYVNGIIRQVVFPTDTPSMIRGAHLLGDLIRTVPAIAADCTPTENAAAIVVRSLAQDQ
jgi:hypothetical protein